MKPGWMNMLAALALPAAAAAQGDDVRPISLDDAIKLGVQNSPTTVSARNTIRNNEQSVRQAQLNFLPTLNLGMSANQRGGTQLIQGNPITVSGNTWSYGRTLTIGSISIYDGGQKWNTYRASQANLDAGVATEISQRYTVVLNVKSAYFSALAAREQLAAAEKTLAQAQQSLMVSAAQVAAGTKTRSDSLSAAVQVGSAQLAILNAQNALVNANAQLTRLVASPFTVTPIVGDTSDVGRIDVDEASLRMMVLSGPTVVQTTAALTAAKASHRAATSGYMPSLAVSGSYGQTPAGSKSFRFGDGDTAATRSTSLNFNVSYPLFDGYRREQGLVTARVNEENAEANLRDAKFLALSNLTAQLSTYRTAQQTIELQKLQIAAAEENLRVVQQQYNIGTKQLLDMLTAQAALDNARVAMIQARFNARNAKANIEQLIGRDLK